MHPAVKKNRQWQSGAPAENIATDPHYRSYAIYPARKDTPVSGGNSRSCDGFWGQYPGIDSRRTAKERFIKSHGWIIQCNSGNYRVSGAEIGRCLGITCSAVTKIGTTMRQRMGKNNALREEIYGIEDGLSAVNG